MQAQSYLMRHPDAVATATRMLDLGTWHIADANYWRAWNRYHLKEYDAAWADVENATRGLSNSRVYMLAGLIAYARKELPTAVQRFDRAYEIDRSACDATWMSGLVSIDQNELAIAAPKFTRGMTCFVSAAAALRQDRARTRGGDRRSAARRRPRASSASSIGCSAMPTPPRRSRRSRLTTPPSATRAPARSGMALNLIDVAIAHPRMSEKAMAMKAAIEKLPN